MSAVDFFARPPRLITAFAVPWNAFVAAFIYYTVLAAIAIGVEQVPSGFMAAAYALPVLAYAAMLASRGVRALANIEVQIGPTPELQLH